MKLFKQTNNFGNNTMMFNKRPSAQPTPFNIEGKSVDPTRTSKGEYGNITLQQLSTAINRANPSVSNTGSERAANYQATFSKHFSTENLQQLAQDLMQPKAEVGMAY